RWLGLAAVRPGPINISSRRQVVDSRRLLVRQGIAVAAPALLFIDRNKRVIHPLGRPGPKRPHDVAAAEQQQGREQAKSAHLLCSFLLPKPESGPGPSVPNYRPWLCPRPFTSRKTTGPR